MDPTMPQPMHPSMSRKITMKEIGEIMKQGKEIWQTRNKKIKIQNKKWRCNTTKSIDRSQIHFRILPVWPLANAMPCLFFRESRTKMCVDQGQKISTDQAKRPQN
jgi:hypothetical protein